MFGIDDIALGAIAAPVVGGALGLIGGQQTNAANAAIASNQMDFQREMSNTAHQREVADLEKAGLNPILSANAGASTPPGASTTMTNPMGGLAEGISNSAKNYMQSKQFETSLDNTNADTATKNATQKLVGAQTQKAEIDAATSAKTQEKVIKAINDEADARSVKAKTDAEWAPREKWINAIGSAVGTGAEAIGGGWAAKQLFKGIFGGGSQAKPGQGVTKDGSLFDLRTGEILTKP